MAPKYQETNNNGFSFLNILENSSKNSKNLDQNVDVYVHPMVKRSASALSSKSLEMCTESLGSETGSDVSENGDEFYQISLGERERIRESQRSKYRSFDRKIPRNDFPPPLTSISGSDGTVKVKQHRENGRLVIKAVSFSNCSTNFQAERTNGRLKLTLLRDSFVNYESERVEVEENESERVEIEEYESERIEMGECECERGEIENYEKGGEVELDENNDDVAATVEEEEGGSGDGSQRDNDGNRWRVTVKAELKMARRCKEGGNGNKVFANWRSSCVAIS